MLNLTNCCRFHLVVGLGAQKFWTFVGLNGNKLYQILDFDSLNSVITGSLWCLSFHTDVVHRYLSS